MEKLKRHKAEPLDLMQYFYGTVHEPFIHGVIQLEGHVDEKLLKRAVTLSLGAAPVLGSVFVDSFWHPYWREKNFTGEDIVKVYYDKDGKEEKEILYNKLLSMPLDIYQEPQLRINLLRGEDKDILLIIINHMVTDGVGFKEYLYLLCKLYRRLEKEPDFNPHLKAYKRSSLLLLKNFTIKEKWDIICSKYDYTRQNQQGGIYLEGDKNNPFFVKSKIERENLALIKEYTKDKGVTINDMLLTAYARMLHVKAGMKGCIIPCPVDLRKYLKPEDKHGISNFISYYYCDIKIAEDEEFGDTLKKVYTQIREQKENISSLKSLLMLEAAFCFIPFYYLKKHFLKNFSVPMFSLTNLGIVEKKLLRFGKVLTKEAYLTATVKYVPYNQLVISTYDDSCTLSCNLYGSEKDKEWIGEFVEGMIEEILLEVKAETKEVH